MAKSFRINEDALEALREEARSETVSLNTFVNQLLVSYAQFGRYLKHMQNLLLSRQTFTELINPLSEDAIIKAAQNAGKTAPRTLIAAIDGEMTVTNVIRLMHSLSTYANWFEYTEKIEGEHSSITVMHEMGRNWSLFIAHYLSEAFAAAGCKAKCDVEDRFVTFTI